MALTYTFTYNEAVTQRLSAVNEPDNWNLQVHKTDSGRTKNLAGAWFALYTPDATEALSDEAYEALTEKPDRTITYDTVSYYLMAVSETGASGDVEWENLMQNKYLYQEIKAPDGYSIADDGPQLVTWDGTNGITQTYEAINQASYDLPKTGGPGTAPLYLAGALLMTGAFGLYSSQNRRKPGKNSNTSEETKK